MYMHVHYVCTHISYMSVTFQTDTHLDDALCASAAVARQLRRLADAVRTPSGPGVT